MLSEWGGWAIMKGLGTTVGVLVVGVALAGPVAFALHQRAQTPNFHIVREGVLYRSAQMSLSGLQHTNHDLGIRTVVNFRDGTQPADRAEEEYCRRAGIRFVRIPPMSWDGVRGTAEVDAGVDRFLAVMRDRRNFPVLVHCMAGIHRTGAYCAIYRMEREGWSNERAIAEMKAHGYANLDAELDIREYLTTYRPAGHVPPVACGHGSPDHPR
jgi:tyrosine-protein phosphatase SIW14